MFLKFNQEHCAIKPLVKVKLYVVFGYKLLKPKKIK